MTEILKQIVPELGGPDQIGVQLICINQIQAEAVRRAIQQGFKTSPVLRSLNPRFSHFLYVTGTQAAFEQRWPSIEAAGIAAAGPDPAASPLAPGQTQALPRQVESFSAWQQRFVRVVQQVADDIPENPATDKQEISLLWIEEQLQKGNVSGVETMLLDRQTIAPASSLRAQIFLHYRTGAFEKVVALYEADQEGVHALPVSGLLAEQLVGAYFEFAKSNQAADAEYTARQIAQIMLSELERLQQADGLRQFLSAHQLQLGGDAGSLSEELARILQLTPGDRIELAIRPCCPLPKRGRSVE